MAAVLPCRLLTWKEVYELARTLARRVRDEGFEPDLVLAVARGGFVPARIVCDLLGIADLASFRVQHYDMGAKKRAQARVTDPIAIDVRGRKILVVDDVNDTGDTLVVARRYLESLGADEVRFGVLQEKGTTCLPLQLVGQHIGAWKWLIYPWAAVEDVSSFVRAMEPEPRHRGDVRRRLREDYDLSPPDALLDDVDLLLSGASVDGSLHRPEPDRSPRTTHQ